MVKRTDARTAKAKKSAVRPKAKGPSARGVRGPRLSMDIDSTTQGYKLVKLIQEQAVEQNMTMDQVADETGISSSTLSHLRRGRRLASALDRDIVDRLAKWMGLPVIAVMILGEQITMNDFYSPKEDMEESIERAMRFILSDPEWGAMIPRAAVEGDREIKLYTIWCYEQATQTRLLTGGVDIDALLAEMGAFREKNPLAP